MLSVARLLGPSLGLFSVFGCGNTPGVADSGPMRAPVQPTVLAQEATTAVGGSNAAIGSDWPRYRGLDGTGISPATGISKDWGSKPPRMLWKTSLTDDGYAGPAVVNGVIYIVDHADSDDFVRALRVSDGKELWRYTYPDATSSNYGFSRATPEVDSGFVYVVSRMGKVLCLNAQSGKKIWQRDLVAEFGGQRPQWDYACSPILDGNRLIVEPGAADAAIVALDRNTGATLMKGGSGEPGYATPMIASINGKKQYVVMQAKKLAGIDVTSGKELWSFPWETSYGVNAATPLVMGDSVFVTSGYGHGCAMIDIKNSAPSVRWQNRLIQAHFSSPIFYQGHIYGTGDPGVLVCIDPATGQALWKQQGFEKGGLIGVDGVGLAHNGSNGDLVMFALDPSAYKELGRVTPLQGQAWTAPVITNRLAVIRNKQTIAVIDLS